MCKEKKWKCSDGGQKWRLWLDSARGTLYVSNISKKKLNSVFMLWSYGNWDWNLIQKSECFRHSSFLNQNKRNTGSIDFMAIPKRYAAVIYWQLFSYFYLSVCVFLSLPQSVIQFVSRTVLLLTPTNQKIESLIFILTFLFVCFFNANSTFENIHPHPCTQHAHEVFTLSKWNCKPKRSIVPIATSHCQSSVIRIFFNFQSDRSIVLHSFLS